MNNLWMSYFYWNFGNMTQFYWHDVIRGPIFHLDNMNFHFLSQIFLKIYQGQFSWFFWPSIWYRSYINEPALFRYLTQVGPAKRLWGIWHSLLIFFAASISRLFRVWKLQTRFIKSLFKQESSFALNKKIPTKIGQHSWVGPTVVRSSWSSLDSWRI